MKTVFTLLFTLGFVYVQLWGWQVLHWEIGKVKQEVQASLPKNESLVLLGFANEQLSALQWENGQEFEWAGYMYDVVETTVKEDSTHFLCLRDERESLLQECLKELKEVVWGFEEKGDAPDESKGSHTKDLFIVHLAPEWTVDLPVRMKASYFYPFLIPDQYTTVLGLPPWQ